MSSSSTSTTATGQSQVFVTETSSPHLPDPISPCADLSRQLQQARLRSSTKQALISDMTQVLARWNCDAVWITSRTKDGNWSAPSNVIGAEVENLSSLIEPKLSFVIQQTQRTGVLTKIDVPEMPGNTLIAVPVGAGPPTDILCGLFPSASLAGAPTGDWIMTLAAKELSVWTIENRAKSNNVQLKSLSDFVNFGSALNRASSRLDAAILMVNELKKLMGATQLALLLRPNHRSTFQLAAVSDVESIDRESETSKVIMSAGLVAASSGEPVFWRKKADEHREEPTAESHLVLQRYCAMYQCGGCALLPLTDHDSTIFGWLLVGLTQQQMDHEPFVNYLQQITRLAAGQLDIVLRSQRTTTEVIKDSLSVFTKKRMVRIAAIALCAFLLAMFIPWTYHVKCDCELQLVRRRFVAAPYTGLLEKTLVENGEVVQTGQLLARMDGRQLRMELSSLQADLQSEKKRRDSALARGVVAESQIASAEMKRLESEIQIKTDRLNYLEIRSPIDGVVVSGDLEKAEGAPLEMGQNLFEVGPLDQLLVEVLVPESDIQYVRHRMPVKLELSAFPFEVFRGNIKRIHPRAEVVENESVFVAEIQIENRSGNLRPGMKGRAKIVGDRYPLGWNLFHGAWEKTRSWLIW